MSNAENGFAVNHLKDAFIEIRFDAKVPKDAIFGLIYNELKESYPEHNKLQNSNFPEQMLEMDPVLKFQPLYCMYNDNYQILIGRNSLIVKCAMPYSGWIKFKDEIKFILDKIFEIEIINRINRFGLRYVNFFKDKNVFEESTLTIGLNGTDILKNKENYLKTVMPNNKFKCILQFSSDSTFQRKFKGSSLDLDTICEDKKFLDIDSIMETIDEAHDFLKGNFKKSLTEEYLKEIGCGGIL
ncbi:MAG: hypothetical protein CMF49_02630 [Legionellales bacterium]|nr:hypothetical protein [Legionellales bacterium]